MEERQEPAEGRAVARRLALRMAALDAAAWGAVRLAERHLTAGRYRSAERALVRALAAVSRVVDLEDRARRGEVLRACARLMKVLDEAEANDGSD